MEMIKHVRIIFIIGLFFIIFSGCGPANKSFAVIECYGYYEVIEYHWFYDKWDRRAWLEKKNEKRMKKLRKNENRILKR